MISRHSRTWSLVCAVAFLASCKCGGPSGNLGDVLGAYCDFIDRCPDQLEFPIAYRNKAECESILEFVTTCRLVETKGPGNDFVASVQKLDPHIDAAQAAACKAYLASASCTAPFSSCDPSTDAGCNPCSTLLSNGGGGGGSETRAGLDEKCDDSQLTCGDGLYCINAAFIPDGGAGCRVCKPTRPLGGDCGDPPHVPCGTGLFCDATGTCAGLLGSGAACNGGSQCLSTFCNGTTQTCDPGGHAGEACSAVGDCRQGYCDSTAHQCADKKRNGSPCAVAEECQSAQCDAASLHCGKPDGATCNYSGECQHACDTSAHLCVAGVPTGQSCTSDEQCQSGACEYYPSHTCVDSCAGGAACPSGQICDYNSHCHPLAGDGADCDTNEACSSGYCNTHGQCGKKPEVGDSCSNYGDCVPRGYCNAGTCAAFVKPGEACTGLDSCAPPFLCQSGTCTLMSLTCAPAAVGSQCTWLQVCDDQGFCDVLNNFTCAAKKAPGASCLRSTECPSGQFCLSGTCSPFAKAGDTCGNRVSCGAGLFCDESVTPNVCSGPKPLGATCQDDVDCQSGDCSYVSGSTTCQAACLAPPPGDQPACHPTKCTDLGYSCGTIDDGCGSMAFCGQCSTAYETCGGGSNPHACGCTPTHACQPRQCNASVDDGCGHQLPCNEQCGAGQTCGGGGAPSVCGCAPDRAAGPSVSSVGASITIPEMGAGFIAWDNVDRVGAEDDAGAHVHFTPPAGTSQQSQFLLASGFGFNLPATAVVSGVEIRVRRQATGQISDAEVALFSGGKRLGSKAVPYPWDATWGGVLMGNSSDLWGAPLTAALVNSPDFGVGVSVTSVGNSDGYVDDVKVTVSYAYRCDCTYLCKSGSQCGSDGCGGTCGTMGGGCGGTNDAGPACEDTFCKPVVYTDPATGLSWHNQGYDYGDCSSLTLGGFSDWRAPTLDELRTLVRGCASSATGGSCRVTNSCTSEASCRDTNCDGCPSLQGPGPYGSFLPPQMQSSWGLGLAYFTSTKDGTSTWTLNPRTGVISTVPQGSFQRYRCVRP